MTTAALILLTTGIIMTFIPGAVLELLGMEAATIALLLIQILGGIYFGFGMLNWMARDTLIGGIYNRPLAIGNLSHFFVSGMALLKGFGGQQQLPLALWGAVVFYVSFGILFALILFTDPSGKTHS